jgi:aryl-alcohol dehydrogenase-like predicted oxidoreductase
MPTNLPTRKLGRFGPEVTAIGAGLMSLGSPYGPAGSDEERFTYLDGLCEMGVTFWDTADRYGDFEFVILNTDILPVSFWFCFLLQPMSRMPTAF